MKKDLVLAYTYKRDFSKALEIVKPMLEEDNVDEQTYQVNELADQVIAPTNPRVFQSSLSFTQQLTNDRKCLFIGLYEQFYRKALENTASPSRDEMLRRLSGYEQNLPDRFSIRGQ